MSGEPVRAGRGRLPAVLVVAIMPAVAGRRVKDLLANDRRRAIYQAVLQNPGVHMRELQRLTGMRWASLQYHTTVLRSSGLLQTARMGRRTVFGTKPSRPEQLKALHLLRSARPRSIAEALARSRAPPTQRELASASRVNVRLVGRYLHVMAELGLVQPHDGRPRRYAATPRLAEMLDHARPRGRR